MNKEIKILAIESSCDETAAAVVVNGRDVRSNIISSQIALHTLYGGVVPEIASRKHVENINYVIQEALDTAQPVVEYLPGWHCDITAARKWEDLPQQARDYVEYLEKAVGCKITYISVGAEREAYIHRG